MENRLPVDEFLAVCDRRVVLDVRAPGEYAQGHIPGACSFPLFSDEERALVGVCYKQKGREAAFDLGLDLIGYKLAGFVRTAASIAPDRQVAIHCWRGGQRSGSMAWLLRQAGFDVITLAGGYKSYRQYVLQQFDCPGSAIRRLPVVVLGGRTGVGKTKILRALRDRGEQIIDLEQLACHKGSAFGFIGEAAQPTVEQFENELYAALSRIDPGQRVWIENESRSIGRVFIPEGFWHKMKSSTLINVEIPEEARIRNLLADYPPSDKDALASAFLKIGKRLGGQHLKTALEALERDDFAAAARIALQYYDKTYQHCLDVNPSPDIRRSAFDHGEAEKIARYLVDNT